MRTLKNLQLLVVSAALVVGMGSCLKMSEPDFGSSLRGYVIQESKYVGADSTIETTFRPYFVVQTNEPARVSIKKGIDDYPLQDLGEKMAFVSNLSGGMMSSYPETDTIPNGNYILTATNGNNEVATNAFTINIESKNKLGMIEVTKLSYVASTKRLEAEWKKVTNAEEYFFIIYRPDNSYRTLISMQTETSGNYTFSDEMKSEDKLYVAIGAWSGGILAESKPYLIKIGTDYK